MRSRLIVEHRTYTRVHRARVRMWEELIKVLHKSSLARMITVYLH